MESPHVVCLACDMNSCGLTCIWLITTYSDDQEKEPFHVVSIIVDQELLWRRPEEFTVTNVALLAADRPGVPSHVVSLIADREF